MIQIHEIFYSGLKQCFFGAGGKFHTTTAKENPVQSVRSGFLEKLCKSRHISKLCSWRLPKQSEILNQMSILLADL